MTEARRPTKGDALLGAAVALAVSVSVVAWSTFGDRAASTGAYVFAIALGALMLGRRRWPVATLFATIAAVAAYYAFELPAIGAVAPTAAAFYSVAERGRLRWAIPVGVAYLAATTWIRATEGGEEPESLFGYELVASASLLAVTIALGEARRAHRGWQEETARRAAQAASEREAVARSQAQAERLLIARELHDVLAHTVTVISLHADVAAEALGQDDGQVARAIAAIKGASRDAVSQMRSTVRLLREPAADPARTPIAGLADLERLAGVARASGLDVDIRVEGTPVRLPAVVDAAAHRIVQESLTNVLRHADASTATVELRYDPSALSICITDDGRGGPVTEPGYGLTGMQERVTLLGGRVAARPGDHGGFRLEAELPLGSWR